MGEFYPNFPNLTANPAPAIKLDNPNTIKIIVTVFELSVLLVFVKLGGAALGLELKFVSRLII